MNKILAQCFAAGVLIAGTVFAASDVRLPDAAMNGDKTSVQSLLKQKVDANSAQPDGTTALHWAAHQNDLELVNLLLQSGANAKAANRYGVTPLSEAVQRGSGALVEALLKAGADPNTLTTEEGETALMTASRTGNAEAAKLLIAKGANVNAAESYRGQTALMWAAAENHADIVKMLMAAKADANMVSVNRDTTLPKLPAGSPAAPISRGGLRAIHFAVRQGATESVKALLDAGVNINEGDIDQNPPLVLAILNAHYDLAQVLIDRGANLNAANKDGRAALFTAVEMRTKDTSPRPDRRESDKLTATDIIYSLVDHGANVNQELTAASAIDRFAQDHGDKNLAEGATPFLRAARSCDMELMKYLMAKGADPKHATKSGLNALLVAAGVGWSDKIQGGQSEAIEAVKFLLDQGLDINSVNERGDTVMHGAATRGADDLVKLLADRGAKLDEKNKQSLTPLDIAMGKGGQPGVVRDPKESTMKTLRDLMKSHGPTAENVKPK